MSYARPRMSVVLGGHGLALAGWLASLAAAHYAPAIFADASGPRWVGPGIEMWLDPFPTVAGGARMEIAARGGDAAGIDEVRVVSPAGARVWKGGGADWGDLLMTRGGRGEDAMWVVVPLDGVTPGEPLELTIGVRFTCAMPAEGMSFTNKPYELSFPMRLVPLRDADLGVARLRVAGGALIPFALYVAGLVAGVRLVRAVERAFPTAADSETMAVASPVLPAVAIALILLYWRGGRPLAAALGAPEWATAATVTMAVVGGAAVFAWARRTERGR